MAHTYLAYSCLDHLTSTAEMFKIWRVGSCSESRVYAVLGRLKTELQRPLGKTERSAQVSRQYILGVLFFGGAWGLSEATLGDALYRAGIPYASVPLTAIGFVVLTFARAYFPRFGTATLIALFALLYKFLNTPFFACHLLGIVLMGVCYDVFFNGFRMRTAWLAAALAAYANYGAFALMITYVARYEHWVQGGFGKILEHVAVSGSLAALACALLVPLSLRLGDKLKSAVPAPFTWRSAPVPATVTALTAGLWVLGIVAGVLNHVPRA